MRAVGKRGVETSLSGRLGGTDRNRSPAGALTFHARIQTGHGSLHCVVSRRIVIAGSAATVVAGATVGLQRAGALDGVLSVIPPAREPDHDDTAILTAVRRRHTALIDLAAQHDVPVVTRTLTSALNSLGGRTGSSAGEPDSPGNNSEPDSLVAALKEASEECADDAVRAHSAALVRTLASLSAGLAQLTAIMEPADD